MDGNDTEFAPAERADAESVLRDAGALTRTGLVEHVTHVIPSILMILNRQRQVVYKNQRLMDLLAASSDEEVLGKRPGELFDCVHSHRGAAGCGTSEFCAECGAVQAILKSQEEKVGVQEECRITTTSGDAYEFRVWASPYTYDGTEYTLFTLQDIGDEKRREVLERTFFHDVNNILFVLSGCSHLVLSARSRRDLVESTATIELAAMELASEITSHRKLLQAERGELSVDVEGSVGSLELVAELARMCAQGWPDRPALRMDGCSDFTLATDRPLLFRVLYNMVKNAYEASSPTEEVTIRCVKGNDSAVFSVHNAVFMPRSTQLQVFQRSFSTKGKGRGIGTYCMKLFGEKCLKGEVWFSSSRNEGTTFFVSLPPSCDGA